MRVYNGRDPETKRRRYLNQTIHGGLRDAQADLNKMLGERNRGCSPDSKQALNSSFQPRLLQYGIQGTDQQVIARVAGCSNRSRLQLDRLRPVHVS